MNTDMPLELWLPLITAALRISQARNAATAEKLVADTQRLFRYLAARGARFWADVTATLVLDWCWAAHRRGSGSHKRTKQATARNRQWEALCALETAASLGAPINPAALVGPRIPRPTDSVPARPLTHSEADDVRAHGDAGAVASRRSAALVAAFAGGTASEIAALLMRDIDLDAGTVAFSGPAARVGPLDDWGIETLSRFVRNNPPIPPNSPLCVSATTSPSRAAHTVTVRLGQVLRDAHISGRPGVTARSIRLTTANQILQTHGIEAAARFLGSPSLDSTADALGYRWGPGDL